MFGRETRMLLRHYLEPGASKNTLARRLGFTRDTNHCWIRDGDLDRDLDPTAVQYAPPRRGSRRRWKPTDRSLRPVWPPTRSCRPYRLLDEIPTAG